MEADMELIYCILCLFLSVTMQEVIKFATTTGLTKKPPFDFKIRNIIRGISSNAWILCWIWFAEEYGLPGGVLAFSAYFFIPVFFYFLLGSRLVAIAYTFLYQKSNVMHLIVIVLLIGSWNKYLIILF